LTVADFLKNEMDVVLLEKNDFIGGRIKTINSIDSYFEIGSQFFCNSDLNFKKLIDKKNLNGEIIPLDFSNISFFYRGELYKNINIIVEVIEQILNYSKDVSKKEYFDEWFLNHFDENKLFIPKGIIKAITFCDSSIILAYYGIYILETFFEECFTFKRGLQEITLALAHDVKIKQNEVKQFYFQKNKLIGIETNDGYMDTSEYCIISTAPPGNIQIDNNPNLISILNKIHFYGCIVIFFKMKSIFPDWPDYIFFPDKESKISVIEQFTIGRDNFIGCLIPYRDNNYNQKKAELLFIEKMQKLFDDSINDKIIETYFYDWKQGMPIVNERYVEAVSDLNRIKLDNLHFAGDYCSLHPSMDSAVKSAYNIIEKICNQS
jgi:protoporphyrinogen oxidase